jgi:glycosyltransferase involved in cell wall biosynthesis
LLAGEGPILDTYKQIVQDYNISNITFVGPISETKKKAFLFQRSDYLIFPSFRE